MNIRKIELELTVALLNNGASRNYLTKIKELMQNFKEQVGLFRCERELTNTNLDNEHSLTTLALEYDNCIVNIDLVTNNNTLNQYLNHLDLAA